MKNRPEIIVGIVVAMFIVGMFFAAQLSSTPDPVSRTGQRLRAEPGKMREGARALVSKLAPSNEDDSKSPGSGKTPDAWAAPKNLVEQTKAAPGHGGDVINNAFNAASPEQGIATLENARRKEPAPGASSRLNSALAQLYAQADGGDSQRVREALANARATAQTPADRHRVLQVEVDLLLQQGETAAAKEKLEAALQDAEVTVPSLHLAMTLSNLTREIGDPDAVAAHYRDVMAKALELAPEAGDEATNVYRLAAMRLARLHRTAGDDHAAESVAREVRAALDRLETTK